MPIDKNELRLASVALSDSINATELSVPTMHCGACMSRIENALSHLDGIDSVRVNLTRKRVVVNWSSYMDPGIFLDVLTRLGFDSELPSTVKDKKDNGLSQLLKALAVSGFASGNIMLLSVSVWSGADEHTRQLFHWISGVIAIPAIAYSAQVFFRSAWLAIKQYRTNMDVPICVGIVLTTLLSIYETAIHSDAVYFEASVMLVFFLLIGRTLDHAMRSKAASTVNALQALEPSGAQRVNRDGSSSFVSVSELLPGDVVLVAANSRIPTDGIVVSGNSSINTELVNGESIPVQASSNHHVYAGTLNLSHSLSIKVTEPADNSYIAKMDQLVQEGQAVKGRYRAVADKVASLYAPVVHLSALMALLFWLLLDAGLHQSLTIAVSVLIITCPCALALAVPMVQAVASQRLFHAGIIMKNGAALEKLASIDTVVFDKTGTLTSGFLINEKKSEYCHESLRIARLLASSSEHPYSKALLEHRAFIDENSCDNISLDVKPDEIPGYGLEARISGNTYRLGRPSWALSNVEDSSSSDIPQEAETVLARNGEYVASFVFNSHLREGATKVVELLQQQSMRVILLSGDVENKVASVAGDLSIDDYQSQYTPFQKVKDIEALQKDGCKVLMVGDGLNDSGAIAGADVSMSPGTGASATRLAADFVLLGPSLQGVAEGIEISQRAARLVGQNFAIAIVYNLIAIPAAFMGFITPLFAALAMSSSSILVIANSLRVMRARTPKATSPCKAQMSEAL
ncbi:MAG: heavy metal translocating P-type ATPase [Granulosicoccus sp.]